MSLFGALMRLRPINNDVMLKANTIYMADTSDYKGTYYNSIIHNTVCLNYIAYAKSSVKKTPTRLLILFKRAICTM